MVCGAPYIDFSINGLCTENLSLTQRTPTPYKNKSKLMDLVMRIELTRVILMPRLSDFNSGGNMGIEK